MNPFSITFDQPDLVPAGGGATLAGDAPLDIRAPEGRRGNRLDPPARGFQLGFESSSLQAPDALLEELAGFSSRKVAPSTALRVPAVIRARDMIAAEAAMLPIELRDRKTRELDERTWLGEDPHPDPDITAMLMYSLTLEDLFFHGLSYWRVLERNGEAGNRFSPGGFPVGAEHLDFRSVSQHATLGLPSQQISQDVPFSPGDPVFIDGAPVLRRNDVITFVSPKRPFLVHAAAAIRTALLLSEAADRYAKDPLPLGYFEDSEDQTDPLEDDEIEAILLKWELKRRERAWGYISKGLKLQQLKWPTADDLQLADARQHAVLEIARASNIDPEDMGVSTTTRTYQNAEERKINRLQFVIGPFLKVIEDRLSAPDITPRHLRARFDRSKFLEADMKTRFTAHGLAIEHGIRRVDEIRREEGWPDFTDSERREAAETAQALVPGIAGVRPQIGGINPFGEDFVPDTAPLSNGHRELAGVG